MHEYLLVQVLKDQVLDLLRRHKAILLVDGSMLLPLKQTVAHVLLHTSRQLTAGFHLFMLTSLLLLLVFLTPFTPVSHSLSHKSVSHLLSHKSVCLVCSSVSRWSVLIDR